MQINNNVKFKKNNRSVCFRGSTFSLFFKKPNFNDKKYSNLCLISLESSFMTFQQFNMFNFTIRKYLKTKRTNNRHFVDDKKKSTLDLNLIFISYFNLSYKIKLKLINKYQKVFKNNRRFKKSPFFIFSVNFFSNTKKKKGVRMGRGKGDPELWYTLIRKSDILVKIRNDVKFLKGVLALKQLQYRLPFKTKLIYF